MYTPPFACAVYTTERACSCSLSFYARARDVRVSEMRESRGAGAGVRAWSGVELVLKRVGARRGSES
jgi:hypothetical protein